MIVLDTDHLTVLQMEKGQRFERIVVGLAQTSEIIGTTIVNVEEQMRGWLASIAKERRPERQVQAYRELALLFRRYARFEIAVFDEKAAGIYTQLRTGRGHLGTQDLKIAAIAIANNALLLTANRRDFEQVPGLKFENWMDAT